MQACDLWPHSHRIVVIVALLIVKIAHRAVKQPLTIKGPLKIVLGIVRGIFYYLILEGVFILVSAIFGSFSLTVSIMLLVTLILFELSVIMKILQEIFEFRDGRKMKRTPIAVATPQAGTTNLAAFVQEGRNSQID